MNDEGETRLPSGNDGGRTLSGREILLVLALAALAIAGGYFFLMKMIDVSRQDDCILAHRRNCAAGLAGHRAAASQKADSESPAGISSPAWPAIHPG